SNVLSEIEHKNVALPLVIAEPSATEVPFPYWDPVHRQLRVSDYIVKHFRWPARNQELVLTAFQEEGWPKQIDDPLSPVDGLQSKERLHDTIKGLNRHQKLRLIEFHGDGSGEGVLWRFSPKNCKAIGIALP
ncbi:MAG: hypothetical protein ABL921_21315, partial [Pirellula sp.]